MATVETFVICVCFLTGVVQVKAGLTCFSFTSFSVTLDTSGVQSVTSSLTTKSCKDNERCSKLKITDTSNKTHESLDCLDQRICNNSISWCQLFTSGSTNLFSTCHVQCCDSNLCARIVNGNTTLTLPTPTPVRPTIPKATCSIFATFKVDFKNKQVIEQETKITEKVCEKNELCGGVTLVDAANKTHYGSDCVSEKLCQNPDIFCKTVTEGSNGTFNDCSLKCCNKSLCLDVKNVNLTSSKCYQHTPFTVNGNSVESNDAELRVKICKKDELCSRATFQDHNNATHISLDCLSKSVCDNPNIICQHLSASNPESAFIRCSIECCRGDFCFTTPSSSDVNECDGTNNCSVNAVCNNTVGSYYCTCKTGFSGNGLTCTDIDECKRNHSCLVSAVCHNTDGSYYCTCKTGFSGNGLTCTDINECSSSPSICGSKSCDNLYGSHRCICPLPQLLIGTDCKYVNVYKLQFVVLEGLPFSDKLPNSKSTLYLKSKQEIENAVHKVFSSQNTDVYLAVHLTSFSIRNGRIFCVLMLYTNPQPSVPITSIANAFRSALNETSTNNVKKFYLDNKYVLNNDSVVDQTTLSSIVVDYDECALTPSPCGSDQRCENFPGTYRCYCKRLNTKALTNGNCLDVKTFQGSITITNLEFNDNFINQASVERLALIEKIENEINQIYLNSDLRDGFLGCRVTNVWKGSLGVSYVLLFKSDAEDISTISIRKTAENILAVNDSGVFFGTFKLEGNKTSAFQYSDYDECDPPDNSVNVCGSNATCTNMESTYSCSCNQGFTGRAPECEEMKIYPRKYVLVEDVRIVKYMLVGILLVYLPVCFLVTLIIIIQSCVISCTKPDEFVVEPSSLPTQMTLPIPRQTGPLMDTKL